MLHAQLTSYTHTPPRNALPAATKALEERGWLLHMAASWRALPWLLVRARSEPCRSCAPSNAHLKHSTSDATYRSSSQAVARAAEPADWPPMPASRPVGAVDLAAWDREASDGPGKPGPRVHAAGQHAAARADGPVLWPELNAIADVRGLVLLNASLSRNESALTAHWHRLGERSEEQRRAPSPDADPLLPAEALLVHFDDSELRPAAVSFVQAGVATRLAELDGRMEGIPAVLSFARPNPGLAAAPDWPPPLSEPGLSEAPEALRAAWLAGLPLEQEAAPAAGRAPERTEPPQPARAPEEREAPAEHRLVPVMPQVEAMQLLADMGSLQMSSAGLLAGAAAAAQLLMPATLPFTAEAVPSLPTELRHAQYEVELALVQPDPSEAEEGHDAMLAVRLMDGDHPPPPDFVRPPSPHAAAAPHPPHLRLRRPP